MCIVLIIVTINIIATTPVVYTIIVRAIVQIITVVSTISKQRMLSYQLPFK